MKKQKRVQPIVYFNDKIVVPPYRVMRILLIVELVCAALMTLILISELTREGGPNRLQLLSSGFVLLSSLVLSYVFLDNSATVTIDRGGVTRKGPVTRKHLDWSQVKTFDVTQPVSLSKKDPSDSTVCFAVRPQEPNRKRTKGPCILVPLTAEEYEIFRAEGCPRCERWRNA